METATAAAVDRRASDAALRAHGERVERLLEDVRGMAGPSTWSRVEELVRLLLELYGAGLARILHHASEGGALDRGLAARLCADELVSSLLLLHGLHPEPTAARVLRAVEGLRSRLGRGIEVVEVTGDGLVRLRMPGGGGGCPSSRLAAEAAVSRAIAEAAPEVTRVELEGAAAAADGARLVTIGRPSPAGPRPPGSCASAAGE